MTENEIYYFWLNGANIAYLENLYLDFSCNKDLVHNSWHKIFTEDTINTINFFKKKNTNTSINKYIDFNFTSQKIVKLINAFRSHGYKYANVNPLIKHQKKIYIKLELSNYNFSEIELKQKIDNKNYINFDNIKNINHLYKKLFLIYCNKISFEYMHIDNTNEKNWLKNEIESTNITTLLDINEKKNILNKLIQSESFENFLSIKFSSAKRFSLEGCEILIPMLDEICRLTNSNDIKKIMIGMAHRGRLNVLANIIGKKYEDLFNEFQYDYYHSNKSGDVKYHMGYDSIIDIDSNKKIELSLKFNPSHLEVVHPVVMGSVRSEIDTLEYNQYNTVLPIAIHGDASITGQGIIQETLNMSQTQAYHVGGTIHIIINNQIGFTTSKQEELRSSDYCSDIGKIIKSPIFHVNADDPESAIFAIRLAIKFRLLFHKDVFIDLVCYRRHGHNEVDDPLVTQPVMYETIKQHETITKIFSKKLIKEKTIDKNYILKIKNKFQDILQLSYDQSLNKEKKSTLINHFNKKLFKQQKINNFIQIDELQNLAIKINTLPNNINVHIRINKIYQSRIDMALGKKLFDWGASETLAYATILKQGISCRISGEDSCRGTFFHRHAVVYNQKNNAYYIPLKNNNIFKTKFNIFNSVLSEEATLAFEYGFSINNQKTLTIWEAQFGDFANVAQVIIDQFISTGEQKWDIKSNIILFLPHGYEGQGPEHSSARIERFLQLCSENNMIICIPSTSGQMYHLLRRQAFQKDLKPLIIMTPKFLLRYQPSCSSIHDLTYGKFQTVINELNNEYNEKTTKRIIFCSGKIYYELNDQRTEKQQKNVLIIRIEQLYPFPENNIKKIILINNHIKDFIWCQEEPKNQGSWNFVKNYFNKIISQKYTIRYIGRPSSAAPATGYMYIHQQQQKKIINDALNINIIQEEQK
ncbi:2-oxoglutarate dehydrogenase E1 component [Buchnera aphidicola]|uniref:2-oxoglutarate dehydrogenase E1 component n=1 Tax=Buchnera aphidicola TaxID=9 RepID=UPI003464AC61